MVAQRWVTYLKHDSRFGPNVRHMKLERGQVAVVTGAASGIGFALAEAFAKEGVNIVLADVEEGALAVAEAKIKAHSVETLAVTTDVRKVESVEALLAASVAKFGRVHIVCNNAGVGGANVDPWTGPLSVLEWVIDVNFWGVMHGIRAFVPHFAANGGGYIVNTASIAGCMTGFSPIYDASKHAVVAISDSLSWSMKEAGLPIGVSCLCPGWVRTGIVDSDRNWPEELGDKPVSDPAAQSILDYGRKAISEGMTPAAVASMVLDAVQEDQFWVFPHQDFLDIAIARWDRIGERINPEPPKQLPGMPPRAQMIAELMRAMEQAAKKG
ncbi:MAG: SDR family NAD(P)-dependent oxidoreductase [Actinobacteria bacterium]|uniref:Unannotated protein n=1 Tax=freshwater metagenome TaxID=449393 RepID=A0A6J7ESX1_9ZZZZ|nr:SDR family NAD(P)-dependent oxidoreductase [Actinomycetota bacterium]MSY12136.1 SDR family NAD(P)-dependent oxidoreductase [Actinomycetota bacterium]MSZ02841.1 SDR family NAD(P)-dependent oxidoreductase [Actinomycetota bacterium]MTB06754.1 SDR family NAD(P)-dependent oxidoreductase [Actinomycetota bacterium]